MVLRLIQTRTSTGASPVQDELRQVAEAAAAGEPGAQRTLIVWLGPHLLRITRRVLGANHPDVPDVVQEAALAVLDGLQRYRGDTKVISFARRIALNTAMNARRRELALERTSPEVPVDDPEEGKDDPETRLLRQQSVSAVRELLATLPAPQAEALGMHCVLGLTVDEIAQLTEAPQETVRSRLKLGRRALRRYVQADSSLRELLGGA